MYHHHHRIIRRWNKMKDHFVMESERKENWNESMFIEEAPIHGPLSLQQQWIIIQVVQTSVINSSVDDFISLIQLNYLHTKWSASIFTDSMLTLFFLHESVYRGTLHENINNLYAFISRALASKYFNPKTSSHKRQFVITLICVIFSNNNKNSVWNVGVFIRLYLLPETFARLRKNESFGYS